MSTVVYIKMLEDKSDSEALDLIATMLFDVPFNKWQNSVHGDTMEVEFLSDPYCNPEFITSEVDKMASTLSFVAKLFAGSYAREVRIMAANKFRLDGMSKEEALELISQIATALGNHSITDQFSVQEEDCGVSITITSPLQNLGFGFNLRVGKFVTECVRLGFTTHLE